MSKKQNNEYKGYQEIIDYCKFIKSQMPKGISLLVNGKRLYFQFSTKYKSRSKYATGENYTILGLNHCLEKAILIDQRLKNYESEIDFWAWYDETIKGINKNATNDLITFKDAINKVRVGFFSVADKRGLPRKEDRESDQKSYDRENGRYFNKLPLDKTVNYQILYDTLFGYCDNKNERKFQDCLRAFLRLCEYNELESIHKKLSKLKVSKNKRNPNHKHQKQSPLTIDEFILFRQQIINEDNQYQEEREFWAFIFSMQVLFGLRIGELLSAKNLDKDYIPSQDLSEQSDDHTIFRAISDPDNYNNYLYIGNYTDDDNKTAKTGHKICLPFIHPNYPNLLEVLEIKQNIPRFINRLKNYGYRQFVHRGKSNLEKWSEKYLQRKISQTHTNRKLGNANGIAAGIPDSIRAKSLGHSVEMNYKYYQNFNSQVILDLFESSKKHKQPISFQLAIKLVEQKLQNIDDEKRDDMKSFIWDLLKDIYQIELPELF